jgi:thiol-disulfide isomerase/thioredoxin
VAVVLLAGAGGFIGYRLFARAHSTLVTIVPAPKAPAAASPAPEGPNDSSAAPTPEAVPDKLPALSLPDTDGKRHSLSEWKGRPLLVNFWATWCAPCRREIPLLRTLRHEHSADALEVVGIAVDFRDAVAKYAHEIGIDYPVLVGEQDGLDAVKAFGMETVFPFSVFADRQGRIVTLKVGELHRDEAELILERLRQVDQGRLELAAAREQISAGISRLAAERAGGGVDQSPTAR